MPGSRGRRAGTTALGIAALSVLAGAGIATAAGSGSTGTRTYTLQFTRAVGLYTDSKVTVLGVGVGHISKITPAGDHVDVKVTVTDSKVGIPQDVQAYIMVPNLVSDRYVQLEPAYSPGQPTLSDGATIPTDRTHAPVEKDDIERSLDRLDLALGPQGANKDGALSRLLQVGAENLQGNGEQLRQTLNDLAQLISALDDNKTGLVGTVDQLDRFSTTLINDDAGIRHLYTDLATVSAQLDADRTALASALKNLSVATGEVASLVQSNRANITSDVKGLLDVVNILVQDKKQLAELLDDAPLALQNLSGTYDPATQTLDTRNNSEQSSDPTYQCTVLQSLGLADTSCNVTLPAAGQSGGGAPHASRKGKGSASAGSTSRAGVPGAGSALGQLLGGLL
jgi:phospholipid/cholesterol/gamma-HCH transport system substrate-binding protein